MAEIDRISQLPVEILDHIMGLMSIQQAAEAAAVCKVWRDVWLGLSCLCFDNRFFDHFVNKYRDEALEFKREFSCFDVITKVLLQHKGSIRKFVFLPSFIEGGGGARASYMDQWLLLVAQRGVEEIELYCGNKECKLWDCIFSCSTLRRLHLNWFFIDTRNFPCCLPNATSLCFDSVEFGTRSLPSYDVDVPKLENLSFIDCRDAFHFNITARNVCNLRMEGCSSSKLGNFLPVNLDVRPIRTLELDNRTLKYFTKGLSPELPPLNVELLKISKFCFWDNALISAFASLLSKCPKLRNLEICFWWAGDVNKCVDTTSERLEKLRRVARTHKMLSSLKLSSFKGWRSEMHLIEEMFACLPALEKIVIVGNYWFDWHKKLGILDEISHFRRASAKAEIAYQ